VLIRLARVTYTARDALEVELRKYEELTATAARVPLTSEKGIERAARAVADASESEKRVVSHAQALVQAIHAARAGQESATEALNACAARIEERRAVLKSLLARFEMVGEVARALNAALQKVALHKAESGADAGGGEAREALAAVESGMQVCAGHAQDVARDAAAADFEELGRHADGLRQQMLAAKNRLFLLKKDDA
jgi:hypothetical protein